MKKIGLFMLSALLSLSAASIPASAEDSTNVSAANAASEIETYDVNDDGVISVADIVSLEKYLMNHSKLKKGSAADINGDGKVNVFDITLMRQKIAEMLTVSPEQEVTKDLTTYFTSSDGDEAVYKKSSYIIRSSEELDDTLGPLFAKVVVLEMHSRYDKEFSNGNALLIKLRYTEGQAEISQAVCPAENAEIIAGKLWGADLNEIPITIVNESFITGIMTKPQELFTTYEKFSECFPDLKERFDFSNNDVYAFAASSFSSFDDCIARYDKNNDILEFDISNSNRGDVIERVYSFVVLPKGICSERTKVSKHYYSAYDSYQLMNRDTVENERMFTKDFMKIKCRKLTFGNYSSVVFFRYVVDLPIMYYRYLDEIPIKNESDDFTSMDEGNTPEAGNYSIEICDDNTIIVSSDDFTEQETYTIDIPMS